MLPGAVTWDGVTKRYAYQRYERRLAMLRSSERIEYDVRDVRIRCHWYGVLL